MRIHDKTTSQEAQDYGEICQGRTLVEGLFLKNIQETARMCRNAFWLRSCILDFKDGKMATLFAVLVKRKDQYRCVCIRLTALCISGF